MPETWSNRMVKIMINTVKIILVHGLLLCSFLSQSIPEITSDDKNNLPKSITVIDSYTQIIEDLKIVTPQDTLVLWDIDGTLLTSPHLLARSMNIPTEFRIQLNELFQILRDDNEWLKIYKKLWLSAERVLIEPLSVELINQLQTSGCSVLGLTAMHSDNHELVGSLPVWRVNMLKSLGIEFSKTHPDQIFSHLPKERDAYPVLYSGLLVTNMQSKGLVLDKFLKQFDQYKRIIFFDDEIKYLEQVAITCKAHNIEYTLFHYNGIKRFPKIWDTKKILKQVATFIQEGKLVEIDLLI